MSESVVKVPLTQGREALVDEADLPLVAGTRWSAQNMTCGKVYAKGWRGGRNVYMHRLIMGATDRSVHVDHRNGNPLDNRRENLRITDGFGNARNRRRNSAKRTSRYKGVFRRHARWQARIKRNGEVINLGRFEFEIEAALAYDRAAKELFGEFAYLNFPEVADV